MRLGLCSQFLEYPIRFRTTTVAVTSKMPRDAALRKIGEICLHNALALGEGLRICDRVGIRAFRVGSGMWPLYTHPESGYRLEELPVGGEVLRAMRAAGEFARERSIRLSFHPDQFTVLSSPRQETVEAARRDLIDMYEMAGLIGADVINVHGGGVYGDKKGAIGRLIRNIEGLPAEVRGRLTLENDDVSYTPSDLLPVCREAGIPLVYDAHHHRCLPDGLSIEEATGLALETWNREPHFHISSPRDPAGTNLRPHADYIRPEDFPPLWCKLKATVDVEAKAKESAVLRLATDLGTGIATEGSYQS
jgi:UV DNA damage endonuclease